MVVFIVIDFPSIFLMTFMHEDKLQQDQTIVHALDDQYQDQDQESCLYDIK